MLIFNCTKAAQDFFTVTRKGKKQTIVEAPPDKDMSEDINHLTNADGSTPQIQQWLLHAVTIKRKHCLIAMEMNTCFSVTVNSVKKADVESYLQYFKTYLSTQVLEYGHENEVWDMSGVTGIVKSTLDHFSDVHFFRRYDRTVQAQLNKVAGDLRYWSEEDPELLTDENMLMNFNRYSNDRLCKSKAYPDKYLIKPNHEMLLVWQQLYQNVTPEQLAETDRLLGGYENSRMEALLGNLTGEFPPSEENDMPPPSDEPTMVIPKNGPLTHSEMVALDDILLKYETDTSLESVSSLHGFLTAIVSGPNMLPPSDWLPCVWGGHEDDQPDWESMDEAQQFMGALFQMMNDISGTLMTNPRRYAAIFIGDDNYTDVSEWCYGYMRGYEMDEEAWEDMPKALSEKLDFLDECAFIVTVGENMSPDESHALNDKIVGIAQELHAYWLKQRSPQQRPDNVVELRPQHPVTSEKVGRNEPCPCGSGKKFKKCCLH